MSQTSINRELVLGAEQRNDWQGATLKRRRKFRRMISLAHQVTFFLGKRFPKSVPLVYVLGYPKSGTTWMCQLLADYLGIPFPQHAILPVGFAAVVHGHEVVTPKYPTGVYIVRDGRDVIVSSFHHLKNEVENGGALKKHRRFFKGLGSKAELIEVLPDFLQHVIENPLHHKWGWGRHVSTFFENENNFELARFEDLTANPSSALTDLLSRLTQKEVCQTRLAETVTRFSFARQAGQGSQNGESFLRKGKSGDWRNYFNRASAELFHEHYGSSLVNAGYEADASWIDDCDR